MHPLYPSLRVRQTEVDFLNMGCTVSKITTLIFILILASLLSASSAGQQPKLMEKKTVEVDEVTKESVEISIGHEEASIAHSRILAVRTNDYGTYDPSPTFRRPPFKLIPN